MRPFVCVFLIFFDNFFYNLIVLYTYLFIYNMSIFIIFWTLKQFINFNFKTIYSFNDLKLNFFFVSLMSISLFSIAGVPPFIGFFSKILLLITLINSNFYFLFFLFFILLFFALYFYLQNLRYLHSTSIQNLNYTSELNMKISPVYTYFSLFLVFFLVFGFSFFEDFVLYFTWLFM